MKPLGGFFILLGITGTTVGAYLASPALGCVVGGGWLFLLGVGMAKT